MALNSHSHCSGPGGGVPEWNIWIWEEAKNLRGTCLGYRKLTDNRTPSVPILSGLGVRLELEPSEPEDNVRGYPRKLLWQSFGRSAALSLGEYFSKMRGAEQETVQGRNHKG